MDNSIKKKIILAPGANGNELYKSLALRGIHTADVSVMNVASLAKEILVKEGVFIDSKVLTRIEQEVIITECIKKVPYFENASISDVQKIVSVINTIRNLVASNDEKTTVENALKKSVFQDKNKAIFDVYTKYITYLRDNNCLDNASVIRMALEKATVWEDAEFVSFEEFPMTVLETALLRKVSGNDVKPVSLIGEFECKDKKKFKIESISNCYGVSNEVEYVLDSIYSTKNQEIDNSVIVVTDTSVYSQLIYDYARAYNLPVVFGCGISLKNTTPGILLDYYYRWCTKGFFAYDALYSMIKCSGFNANVLFEELQKEKSDLNYKEFYKILSVAGGLKLTNNKDVNKIKIQEFKEAAVDMNSAISSWGNDPKHDMTKYVQFLEVISKELTLPLFKFIKKYSRIRSSSDAVRPLDTKATEFIYNELYSYEELKLSSDDFIVRVANLISKSLPGQASKPGALYVTDISGALMTYRKNLYVLGLTAKNFPGSPKENYMLLDTDLEAFRTDENTNNLVVTSDIAIERKKKSLMALIRNSIALGIKVYLSYPGLNVSELKTENASSTIFDICKMENPDISYDEVKAKINVIAFFEPKVSSNRLIGEAYLKKDILSTIPNKNVQEKKVKQALSRAYSPTELHTFFDCKKKFYYKSVLGLNEDENFNVFETISAADVGILAHFLMEELVDKEPRMNKEEFIKLSERCFRNFFKMNPPLVEKDIDGQWKLFEDMMKNAYDKDPNRKVPVKETDFNCKHSTGVLLHGFPDRVELLNDGDSNAKYIIVDYKTGQNVAHIENDINTCFQTVVYAYILTHNDEEKYNVVSSEYRYLRENMVVTCTYDKEREKELTQKLKEFKESMNKGEFPVCDDETICKYCSYKKLCGRN